MWYVHAYNMWSKYMTIYMKLHIIYVVNAIAKCHFSDIRRFPLNLPKNITKKYIFILNRVLKPTTLYMWTLDISLFLYEKKEQIIQSAKFAFLNISKKIKSKYRSENSIYRIYTGYMQTKKNQPQRHFQTKYTYNQCQRRKYRCLDRHIQLNIWTVGK